MIDMIILTIVIAVIFLIASAIFKPLIKKSAKNNMFWTKWVRGISKVIMVVLIIAILVCGITLCDKRDDVAVILGIVIMVIGIPLSITMISLAMMISEISINTYNTFALLKHEQPDTVFPSEEQQTTANTQQITKNTDTSWVCSCGKENSATANYCKYCGERRKDSQI